jgi:hypothetical protein
VIPAPPADNKEEQDDRRRVIEIEERMPSFSADWSRRFEKSLLLKVT